MREASFVDRGIITVKEEKFVDSSDRKENIFGTTGNAVSFFAAESFRRGQQEAIEEIEAAFDEGFDYVILEGPTGLGKSNIARAFAAMSNSCHILTVQKILQDQYARDFGHEMFIMKGRGAYTCTKRDETGKTVSCAKGLCKRQKGINCKECPYKEALRNAIAASMTVHNFDSFYYQTKYARAFSRRRLLVVDECHNIENKFLNFIEFTVSNKRNSQLVIPEYSTIPEYDSFLESQLNIIEKRLGEITELLDIDENILTADELKEYEDLNELSTKLHIYFAARKRSVEYVFDYKDYDLYQSITFRPLFVGSFVMSHLMPYGEKVLMMSATILDKKIFCDSIGLDSEKAAYITVNSYFPVENRPIYARYCGSMSWKNITTTLPKMVETIKVILKEYPDCRGIIHTVSKKVAEYIKKHCRNKRFTYRMDYFTVNDMLKVHEQKIDSIIVASGLKEGIDLYGDLSRLQIIAKIPFPSLADKRIKRRKEIDPNWYGYLTVLMLIQSLGRSVRSATDSAVTFILDESFDMFYRMNKRFIPKYIRKALKRWREDSA